MRGWLVAAALVWIAGCASAPIATPQVTAGAAQRVPMTPQLLGALIEDHFGAAYALAGSNRGQLAVQPTEWVEGIAATAYYRAAPGVAERRVTLGYSPVPSASISCPSANCVEQDGTYVRTPRTGTPDVLSPRDTGLVQVQIEGANLSGPLLADAIALAGDPRILPLADKEPSDAAAANPLWRADDLGCGSAVSSGRLPLPAKAGSPEPPTPQALAAVIASHLDTGCAGGRSQDGLVEATAYLGADTERVSLAISDQEPSCGGLDTCATRDGLMIGWQFDVPDGHSAMVRLVRPGGDGHHWVVVEHHSLNADAGDRSFPVPLATLLELVRDERVGQHVDAALNRAGDGLPLRWRLAPHTVE